MFGRWKNSSRKWCCMGFEGRYAEGGRRGLSVLVENGADLGARFSIQSRAVEISDQGEFQRILQPSTFPVSIVTETGMQFCPWCGVNLKRFYGNRAGELDRPGLSIPLPTQSSPR
jgi:hypothetical protein